MLERGYETIPQSPQVMTGLIKTYLAAGNTDRAVDLLKTRLKANDQDLFAHNLLGEIFLTRKQYDDAAKAFDKAIAIRPEWQTPHNNLAGCCFPRGKQMRPF